MKVDWPTWFDDRVEVRQSPLHGRGAFVTGAFQPGEVITVWAHSMLIPEEANRVRVGELYRRLDGRYLWLPAPGMAVGGYDPAEECLNHSCDPNVWMAGEITLTVRKAIQHPGGLYVVQDPASRRYLPYPGRSPYSILFLAKEQYDAICREVEHREIQQILDSVGTMIHEFPEMSFDGRSIKAPADYASADADKLDHALIEA